ncbi:MAG TPA: cell division protein FtsK [Lachnospiraceae bacterium]|nr:cell division protein FtsK [Lachnospiraceae bacterium]
MASNAKKGKKGSTSVGRKNTSVSKTTAKRTGKGKAAAPEKKNSFLRDEVVILLTLLVSILLLISNFGFGGFIGDMISGILFGIFGIPAYIIPIVLFIGVAFTISNKRNVSAYIKTIAGILLICMICTFIQLMMDGFDKNISFSEYYTIASRYKTDGGIIGGTFAKLLCPAIGLAGTYVFIVIVSIICIVVITERSFLKSLSSGGKKAYTSAKEDAKKRKVESAERRERKRKERTEKLEREELERARREREENQRTIPEEKKDRKGRKVVSGVSFATTLKDSEFAKHNPEMKELVPEEEKKPEFIINRAADTVSTEPEYEEVREKENVLTETEQNMVQKQTPDETADAEPAGRKRKSEDSRRQMEQETAAVEKTIQEKENITKKAHVFPPFSLMKRGKAGNGDSDAYLRETALKLQQTLHSFGVNVTITNVSCGPSVTRYELQPEQGVKVSKIVGLADDIKLNLAAADIRIEAPIPGKAAVGIEVPNRENTPVMLRDLLESEEFRNHPSKIAFAVGRDIAGKVVVADIKKMPHLLIAGATGSGKSVCINTLIMSILYKARPDEVKLIMVDPKVVELSVYNGIPHLMIPVVTDPKKAAGALNWAVTEMEKRYQLFAAYNVRDLEGYNEKVEGIEDIDDPGKPKKLPQLVIIVDELADLMMVAPGEVEEAICRLAQLARAAGIHLVLATQRPSVNVITGLIKANMPSRIAFSVSSGVDSRIIIDMNGAEKLLGKGDMLFYPAGYQKPARVQGSFVSDKEVQDVVAFLVNKNGNASYSEEITNRVNSAAVGNSGAAAGGDERDSYFVDAGKFIIEKDKASIGMLQRVFKIGFNRAARIMDQLAEAGVVGEEEGTKPRKVLMSMEQFEQYIEEYL